MGRDEVNSSIGILAMMAAIAFGTPMLPYVLRGVLKMCLAFRAANKPKFGKLVWQIASPEAHEPSSW